MSRKATHKYGTFQIVLPVPEDTDKHRCDVAREQVREMIGIELVEAWIIQSTIPVEPHDAKEGMDYYRFGGNVDKEKL